MENENELQDSPKPEDELSDSEFTEEFQDDEPDVKIAKLEEANKKLFARAKKAEEENKAFKQAPKAEEKPQVEKVDPIKISEEMIDKKVSEKLEERELDSMDLSDSLKTEVRAYAKVKGLSIRQAEKSDYISFLKEKESDKVREEEASASSKTKSNKKAKRDFGSYTEKDITNLSGEEFEEYQKWLKAQ